jgi:hypothetical protein
MGAYFNQVELELFNLCCRVVLAKEKWVLENFCIVDYRFQFLADVSSIYDFNSLFQTQHKVLFSS